MKQISRTKNVTINASFGMISQVIKLIIEFIIRTIFIKTLGSEYLGVNGLFTNILTVLSFAELGIGNAIIFSMYKEIANDNKDKIKSLMLLYRRTYNIIGTIVLIIGLAITPFINYIISDKPNINESLNYIYILFLLNTALSYFFSYKKTIISAHQKEYIINTCKLISEIIKAVLQIIILLKTKNFVLYLIIQILCTLLDNILASVKANQLYPYINDKDAKDLSVEEKNNIFKNVKSLFLYKFGSVILNGTDNIIISKMLGIVTVGIVSNYYLISNTISTIVGGVLNGFTASIGNLNAGNDLIKQEKIFNQLFMLCVWIYGLCSIGYMTLANDFVDLWVGENYKIGSLSLFAISLHIYINGVQFAGYTYRTTLGLFNKGKLCPIIAATINIILSIILCKYIGLSGIIFATSISRFITTTWYDIYMVHKIQFQKKPIAFYLKYLKYFVLVLITGILNVCLLSQISVNNILHFILKFILCVVLTNLVFFICFGRTNEFKELVERMKNLLWKRKKAKSPIAI